MSDIFTLQMFGKGVYLADMSSKSANYCHSYASDNTALLLLCEAELGKPMLELTDANYNAPDLAEEKGCIATLGQGMMGPSKWKDAGCLDKELEGTTMPDMSVPFALTQRENAQLYYNEYICYNTKQIRLRYLFRVTTEEEDMY